MRYPYELNLVGDAKTTLQALIPLLTPQEPTAPGARTSRTTSRDWWQIAERRAMTDADPVNPMRIFYELSQRLPVERDRRGGLRQRRELVRAAPAVPRRHARFAVRHAGDDGRRRAVRDRRQVGASRTGRRSRLSATARCR